MSIINSQPLIGASGQGGYFLTKSLRFRSSASATLSRTPGSASNRKTWTWSGWVKRGALGSTRILLNAGYNTIPWFVLGFGSGNTIDVAATAGSSASWQTTALFRDPSAWYHVVLAVDTTSATSTMNGSSTDRFRLYVNGTQYVISGGTVPTQNSDLQVNNTVSHTIGGYSGEYFDGYLTEINFIDGQALTPSSFGETSTSTGVWIPKKYTGTYGTNGFYLPFTDVATTSGSNAGLGKDFSGNGNYWTTNNISVTSGTTYDSMSDVPTLTSATAANYCVLNPIALGTTTLSDGNLKAVLSTTTSTTYSTVGVTTGKWYWEVTYLASTSNALAIGVNQMGNITTLGGSAGPLGTGGVGYYGFNGNKYVNGTGSSYGATFTTNDVIGVALDATGGTITFYKNNTSQGTISLPTLTSSWDAVFDNGSGGGTQTMAVNFGQQPFAYTPPTGFVALNTFNLSTPTIGATASTVANKYFDATLWTGNGSSQTITNSGSMQPDFLWYKDRANISDFRLFDSVRGVTKALYSDATDAEATEASALTSFNSNGFTLGSGSGNTNTRPYVGWQWKANGSGSTNTAGSITSTVSANTTAGFSIVTYTGNSTVGATVGHGLGVAPNMIIIKSRSNAYNWVVGAKAVDGFSSGKQLYLNTTSALVSTENFFNNTQPTSTVFTVKDNYEVNFSGYTYVAYCFAQVAGYSAFGSYTGNGSTDGTFVHLGFRPRFVMIKSTVETSNWFIYDTARNTYNAIDTTLFPSASNADYVDSTYSIDVLSNGFKIRGTGQYGGYNNNGNAYIYACFAETPFKFSNAR